MAKIAYRKPGRVHAAWLLSVWFVFHGISAQAETHDCGDWAVGAETFEYSGVRLGSLLSALSYARTLNVPLSGPRYFDGLEVETFLVNARAAGHPNFLVETILCKNAERLIVGTINGELAPRQMAIDKWTSIQITELSRDGVQDARQERRGNDRYVWGVKIRSANANLSGVGGYLLLRRRCRTSNTASEPDVCGATGWQVHRALAKTGAVQ